MHPLLPCDNDALRRYHRALARACPALRWWPAGMKTWETLLAAPEVIAQRTTRMMTAGPFPAARDRREFVSMGAEKVMAFSQAWFGASREMFSFQQQMAHVAGRQWWALVTAFRPVPGHRGAGALLNPAATMASMLGVGNRAVSTLPRVAHRAVSPIHARATSNARRLRRGA